MEHPSRENPEMTNRSKDYEKGGFMHKYFLQMQSKRKKSEKMTLFSLEMRELASNINS